MTRTQRYALILVANTHPDYLTWCEQHTPTRPFTTEVKCGRALMTMYDDPDHEPALSDAALKAIRSNSTVNTAFEAVRSNGSPDMWQALLDATKQAELFK